MAKKKDTTQFLANVPTDKRFWCQDGKVFANLKDLRGGFEQMSDETFRYHADENKNDFSNWIQDVIGDTTLASSLRKAKNREIATAKLVARLKTLEKAA